MRLLVNKLRCLLNLVHLNGAHKSNSMKKQFNVANNLKIPMNVNRFLSIDRRIVIFCPVVVVRNNRATATTGPF